MARTVRKILPRLSPRRRGGGGGGGVRCLPFTVPVKNLPVRSLPFITALFLAAVVGLTALALAAPTQQAEARDASVSNHTINNVKGCREPMTKGGTTRTFVCFDRETQNDSANPTTMDFNMPEGKQIIQLDYVYLWNDGDDGVVYIGFDTDWALDNIGIPQAGSDRTSEKLVPSLDPPNGGAGLTVVIKYNDKNTGALRDEVLIQYGVTPSEDSFFRDGHFTSTDPNYVDTDEDYYGIGKKFTLKNRNLNLLESGMNMQVSVYYKDLTKDDDQVVVCGWDIPLAAPDVPPDATYVGYKYQYMGENLPPGWYISANPHDTGDKDHRTPGKQTFYHEYHLKNSYGVTVPGHDDIDLADVPGGQDQGLNSRGRPPAGSKDHYANCLMQLPPPAVNPDYLGFDA